MGDLKSDPPVSVPPLQNGQLVITAGKGNNKHTLTIKTGRRKKLRLIVERDGVRFEAPIDSGQWSLDII